MLIIFLIQHARHRSGNDLEHANQIVEGLLPCRPLECEGVTVLDGWNPFAEIPRCLILSALSIGHAYMGPYPVQMAFMLLVSPSVVSRRCQTTLRKELSRELLVHDSPAAR